MAARAKNKRAASGHDATVGGGAGSDNSYEGIFGSPAEPLFSAHPAALHPDLLSECLVVLAAKTTADRANCASQGLFKTGQASEFIFLLCDRLHLSDGAKYLALELFDRFMVQHVREVHELTCASATNRTQMDWSSTLQHIHSQLALRAMSCCQIASKLISHYNVVARTRMKRLLAELGHKYTVDTILRSELRVLKTLDYRVMLSTPLTVVETLLQVLAHNDKSIEVKVYYGVCIKMIDFMYMRRREVYDKLYEVATGMSPVPAENRRDFLAVENDLMLQAEGLIAAASCALDTASTQQIVEHLSSITQTPSGDIADFATVLMQLILADEGTPNP